MSAPPDQLGSAHSSVGGVLRRFTAASWSVVLAAAVVVGGAVLALAVGGLREAHLYRQRTGEGLEFLWVAVGFFVANVVLGAALLASVRLASESSNVSVRRALLGLAVAIIVALIVADALAVWVETRGDRCIGPCG